MHELPAPGAEAVLIGERQVTDYGSSSVETLPVTCFEDQRASPGEKRKCSDAWTDRQKDRQIQGDTRNTDGQKPSESSQPRATVIVVNMGATAPKTTFTP